MFDCEGPTLVDIPVPLRPRPDAVPEIPIEEEGAPPGAGEGTVRLLPEAACTGAGRLSCAVRGLLLLLGVGVTAADVALIYR